MWDSKTDTDVLNSLLDSVGENEGVGMIWQNGTETCKLSYVKQITSPGQPRELLECWINSLQVQPLPLWVLSDSSSFQPWVFGFCPDPSCRKTFVFPLVLSLYFTIKYQLWCCLQMHNPNLLQISLRPETPGMQQWVDVIPSPNSFSSFSSLGIYSAVIGT